jgi:hypothetical protein
LAIALLTLALLTLALLTLALLTQSQYHYYHIRLSFIWFLVFLFATEVGVINISIFYPKVRV